MIISLNLPPKILLIFSLLFSAKGLIDFLDNDLIKGKKNLNIYFFLNNIKKSQNELRFLKVL